MEEFNPTLLSVAQLAARDAADQDLARRYPDHDVGYIDTWQGESLVREVLAASPDLAAFHAQLGALAEEVYRRLRVTRVPAPDEPIRARSLRFITPT